MIAPLTLLFTQFLWFVLPTLLESFRLADAANALQQRDSGGAALGAIYLDHQLLPSARSARGGPNKWRFAGYFLTLVAGGIALFIPGPWLVSYIFHYDFTTSFLIFTALVNIHHFLLDGAIWKLRDSRVSSVLVAPRKHGRQPGAESQRAAGEIKSRLERQAKAHVPLFVHARVPRGRGRPVFLVGRRRSGSLRAGHEQ